MKDELNRKIRELCDAAGSSSAAAMAPVLTADMDREYDRRIRAGMSELDAYRDVLRSVDRIEAMLRALPKDNVSAGTRSAPATDDPPESGRPATPEGEEAYSRSEGIKTLKFYTEKASSLLWVGTTLLYFLWSFVFGGWGYTWLIFLWATLGQILLSAAVDHNRNHRRNVRKTMHDSLSGCLWVGAVIVFFLAGLGLHLWQLSWLVFLAATIVQILMETFLSEK